MSLSHAQMVPAASMHHFTSIPCLLVPLLFKLMRALPVVCNHLPTCTV